MLPRRGFLASIPALALAMTTPALAKKKSRVVWGDIKFPNESFAHYEPALRKFLEKEGRRANWGKSHEPVEANVDVRELRSGVEGDVCKVSCAAVGKIRGIGAAKSKFSYGGKPQERAKLEQHVLELVARGIVTRLAEMARTQEGAWHVER